MWWWDKVGWMQDGWGEAKGLSNYPQPLSRMNTLFPRSDPQRVSVLALCLSATCALPGSWLLAPSCLLHKQPTQA